MGQFFVIVNLINNWLPLIIKTVKVVEMMVPDEKSGDAKLKMVLTVLEQTYKVSGAVKQNGVDFTMLAPVITEMIAGLVGHFNSGDQSKWKSQSPGALEPATDVVIKNETTVSVAGVDAG